MPMQIIEKLNSHNNAGLDDLATEMLEPVFLSNKILAGLSKSKSAEKIIDFMAQQIVLNPANLQLHLNRIHFYSQQNNHEGVYGALLDLFSVLKEKGLPLRKRLLKKHSVQLKPEQGSILSKWLSGKMNKNGIIPHVKESILNDGRTGTLRLLIKQKSASEQVNRDVVEDARDLINSGQVGEATVLLKKALLVNPRREDIGLELMIIYRHSRNYQAVEKILQSTKDLPLALRPRWEELAVCLKSDVDKDNRQVLC